MSTAPLALRGDLIEPEDDGYERRRGQRCETL